MEGDGEAQLPSPFRPERMAAPRSRFHFCLPSVPTHSSRTFLPSSQVRKILSPQMAGVDDPSPGRGNFQARFLSALHSTGRSFDLEMPLLSGPRH